MAGPNYKHSKPPAGNKRSKQDFFHQMLRLEKQTMEQRRSPQSSPTLSSNHSKNASVNSFSPQPSPVSINGFAPKPQRHSMAFHTVTGKTAEPLRIVTKSVSQDSIAREEICHSPSWSNHGKDERKKKKEKMRKQQEAENRKPPKRLNKNPPPAAMETQKMSADLRKTRRNSITSLMSRSSREPSLERPTRERRLSGASLAAFLPGRRSQSQQRPQEEQKDFTPIVSPVAPKLPSFRWKNPSDTKTSWGENNGSQGSLVGFPYQAEKVEPQSASQQHTTEKVKAILRSSTEPVLKDKRSSDLNTARIRPTIGANKPAVRPMHSEQAKPREMHHRQSSDELANELIAMLSEKGSPTLSQTSFDETTSKPNYVHKQRMLQQQRSIADFGEQEVLQTFNEQAALAAMQQDIRDMREKAAKEPAPIITNRSRSKSRDARSRRPSASPAPRLRSQSRGPARRAASKQPSLATSSPSAKPSTPQSTSATPTSQPPTSPVKATSQQPIPARRSSSQQPRQPALSPLKQVSAPEESDDEDEKFKRAKEEIAMKMANFQLKSLHDKPEKKFGFLRKHKDVSSVKEDKPAQRLPVKEEKQSARNRMSAHMHFKKRESSVPALSRIENPVEEKQVVPTSLAAAVQESLSPVPLRAGHRRQASSIDSTESWHSTTDQPDLDLKRTDTTASLAAAYSEGLKTPSSEEDLSDCPSPVKEKKPSSQDVQPKAEPKVIRKSSMSRPRSMSNLQTQPAVTKIPNLDFLPQLKHQPLPKPRSAVRSSMDLPSSAESSPTRAKMTVADPKPSSDLSVHPRSALRSSLTNRSATSLSPQKDGLKPAGDAKPIAKLFVICCKCRFWHDLPSKLYEAMALPKDYVKGKDEGGKEIEGLRKGVENAGSDDEKVSGKMRGRLETAVMCPWCDHGMTTACCQGWTTVVYMHERHH